MKKQWKNLLENKCPLCSQELQPFPLGDLVMCTISCGFLIKREKMDEIISNIQASQEGGEVEEENL